MLTKTMSQEENRRRSARQEARRERLEARLREGRERQQQLEDDVSSILDEIEQEENSISGTPVAGAVREAVSESRDVPPEEVVTLPPGRAQEAATPTQQPIAINLLEQRVSQLEQQTPRPPPSVHGGSQLSYRNDRKFHPKPPACDAKLFYGSVEATQLAVQRDGTKSKATDLFRWIAHQKICIPRYRAEGTPNDQLVDALISATADEAQYWLQQQRIDDPYALATPEMVIARLSEKYIIKGSALRAFGSAAVLSLDHLEPKGTLTDTERQRLANVFFQEFYERIRLGGKLAASVPAVKALFLVLAMPREVDSELFQVSEIYAKLNALTMEGDLQQVVTFTAADYTTLERQV